MRKMELVSWGTCTQLQTAQESSASIRRQQRLRENLKD
ncbi:unnamed protein product [Victoria cruziana]